MLLAMVLRDGSPVHWRPSHRFQQTLLFVAIFTSLSIVYAAYDNVHPSLDRWSHMQLAAYQTFGRTAFALCMSFIGLIVIRGQKSRSDGSACRLEQMRKNVWVAVESSFTTMNPCSVPRHFTIDGVLITKKV